MIVDHKVAVMIVAVVVVIVVDVIVLEFSKSYFTHYV